MSNTNEINETSTDKFNLPKYSVPYNVGLANGDVHFDCSPESRSIEVLPYLIKKSNEHRTYKDPTLIPLDENDLNNITELIKQKVKGKDAQDYQIESKSLTEFIMS